MYPGRASTKEINAGKTTALPFKQTANSGGNFNRPPLLPAVNITETTTEYRITIASPGMQREDFSITVEQCVISISAKKENEFESNNISYRCEYDCSEWTRAFALPQDADVVLAHAKYKNGELIIRIPRGNTSDNHAKAIVYIY
jgi:HSP20 family protein